MTTLAPPGARTGPQPSAGPDGSGGTDSAWTRFVGSWGIALRMAKRDVRRHKGRSALIVVMVALPTLLLVFAIVSAATSQVTGPEQIPRRMGNGVANLEWPQTGVVSQPFDPSGASGSGGEAQPVPGWVERGSAFDNAEAVSSLTRATAVPYVDESLSTRLGDRRLSLQGLAIDPRPGLRQKVEVESGRLPERIGEALVSVRGVARGLPSSGPLTVRAQGKEVELDVVGTASVLEGGYGGLPDLVVPRPLIEGQAGGGWILLGADPVTWPDVERLNTYGFLVYSADVLRNPPPLSAMSPDNRDMVQANQSRMTTFVAIGGALLLVITTLLVGPAFAVSASRQRRTLALSASNGATTGQLRHTVLAQAVVLGVVAALAGSALGVGLAALFSRVDTLTRFIGAGPLDIPLVPVALVTLAAAASAVIAALLPARRLGRLDIIGVMKGQSVSPRPSRTVFLVGALLAGLGSFGVLTVAAAPSGSSGTEVKVVAATVALVVGAIMLAPMILVAIARLSSPLPVSLRMATRDAGRQRSRSVPAVAAILAGVAVLTMVLIASGSDEEQSRREYTAQNVPGDAKVYNNGGPAVGGFDLDGVASGFARVRAGLQVSPVSAINTGDPWMTTMGDVAPTKPFDLRAVNVVPPGCTPERTVSDTTPPAPNGSAATAGSGDESWQPPCQRVGTQGMGNIAAIAVLPTAEIVRRLRVLGRESDGRVVEAGGVVVGRVPGTASLLTGGRVTIMSGTQTIDPTAQEVDPNQAQDVRDIRTLTVPAVEVELTKSTVGTMLSRALLVPDELARNAGWPVYVDQLTVHDPAGPISQDLTERLAAAADDELWVETERGFQSPLKWIVLILVGIFTLLLLVITLTSTALTLAEQENDQATLAALGSGRGTRRLMAAAQAFTLCLIGAVLGVAVGIVPGIALAYPLTAQSWDPITGAQRDGDPILVFPWLVLVGFVVVVPAVAAGLAAAGIRRAPNATHRTA